MTLLFESPLPILFVGVLTFVLVLAVWLQTRKRVFLIAAVLIIGVTAAAMIIERTVVTETEELETTIHEIASAMETNQVESTIEFISEKQSALRNQASSILKRVKVQKVSIKPNLKVEITEPGRRAKASFNAVARVDDKSGSWRNQVVPRFLIVDLEKQEGKWKVVAYEEKDPRDGMRAR